MDQLDVVVVAYYDKKTALNWIKDAKTRFPMFLDQNLKVYDALGYHKTFVRMFGRNKLGKDIKITFHHLFSSLPYIKGGQTPQMGGDMITNKEGKILYIHRSESPDDRPSPEELVTLLKTLD